MSTNAQKLYDTAEKASDAMLNLIIKLKQEAQANEQRIKELEDENHELRLYANTRILKQTQ